MDSQGIAIVGGGIAGQALCEGLRERDPEVPITLICGEDCLPYDRVRLSEILVSGRMRPPSSCAPTSGMPTVALRC